MKGHRFETPNDWNSGYSDDLEAMGLSTWQYMTLLPGWQMAFAFQLAWSA